MLEGMGKSNGAPLTMSLGLPFISTNPCGFVNCWRPSRVC